MFPNPNIRISIGIPTRGRARFIWLICPYLSYLGEDFAKKDF